MNETYGECGQSTSKNPMNTAVQRSVGIVHIKRSGSIFISCSRVVFASLFVWPFFGGAVQIAIRHRSGVGDRPAGQSAFEVLGEDGALSAALDRRVRV